MDYRPNSFSYLPLVVKNLIIINGLFFLASLAMTNQGINLEDILGLHYPLSEQFRPHQLVTYLFMHGGFMHLFFNMFALWMFGNTLENLWGPKRFLIFYMVTGIGAALCHYTVVYFQMQPVLSHVDGFLANPTVDGFQQFLDSESFKIVSNDMVTHYNELIPTHYSHAIMTKDFTEAIRIAVEYMHTYRTDLMNGPVVVGASGAVFGILLAFGMIFPNTMLYVYFAIPIKAKWFVLIYGALELFNGIANDPGDNVAHFAHLGGMLFGFFLIKYWQRNRNQFY